MSPNYTKQNSYIGQIAAKNDCFFFILKPKLKFDCLFSECNRQSEVIRLLEEYQNFSSTGSEEAYSFFFLYFYFFLIFDLFWFFSECNRQSEVIRLLEEYQNSSSTGSEEAYYDDYETEDPNCTCDSGHTHEHQVSTI